MEQVTSVLNGFHLHLKIMVFLAGGRFSGLTIELTQEVKKRLLIRKTWFSDIVNNS